MAFFLHGVFFMVHQLLAGGVTEPPDDLCPSEYLKKYHNNEFCRYLQNDIGVLNQNDLCILPESEAEAVGTNKIQNCPLGPTELCKTPTRVCKRDKSIYSVKKTSKEECRLPQSEASTSQLNLQKISLCPQTQLSTARPTVDELLLHEFSFVDGYPAVDLTYISPCPGTLHEKRRDKVICGIPKVFVLLWDEARDIICQVTNFRKGLRVSDCPKDIYETEFFQRLQALKNIHFDFLTLEQCGFLYMSKVKHKKNLPRFTCKYRGVNLFFDDATNRLVCRLNKTNLGRKLYIIKPCKKEYFLSPPLNAALYFGQRDSPFGPNNQSLIKIKAKRKESAFVTLVIEGPMQKEPRLNQRLQVPVLNWVNNSIAHLVSIGDLIVEYPDKARNQELTKRSHKTMLQLFHRTSRQAVGRIVTQFTVVVLRDEADAADFPTQVAQTLKKNVHKFDAGGEYQIDPNSIQVKQVVAEVQPHNFSRRDTLTFLYVTGVVALLGLLIVMFVKKHKFKSMKRKDTKQPFHR